MSDIFDQTAESYRKLVFLLKQEEFLPTIISSIASRGRNYGKSLLKIMQKDKKSHKGDIQFILCKGIGAAFIKQSIDKIIIKKTIEEFLT